MAFGYGEAPNHPAPRLSFRLEHILSGAVDIDAAVEEHRSAVMFHMPSMWREHFYSLKRVLQRDLKHLLDDERHCYVLARSTFSPRTGIKLFNTKVASTFKLATYETFARNFQAATGSAFEGANLNDVLISGILTASCLDATEGIALEDEDQVIE
ncbi:hypothetical protein OC835_003879 [Tilletia horrida]|nr:hypothetical protein OC835_003879 [Tilletia horrida]